MPTPNTALRLAREGRGWTQAQVAEHIKAALFTVYRWEAGLSIPSLYYLPRLCDLFGCDARTLGFAPPTAVDSPASVPVLGAAEAGTADKRSGRLPAGFGQRLAQARLRLQLSQEALAEGVGVSARSVIRWEQEVAAPHAYYRERLCFLLKSTPQALFGVGNDMLPEIALPEALWQVPYLRNRYFTGREDLLNELHARLHGEHSMNFSQPQVLCGLGGIGKTQTALEYAYRYRGDYQAVLWVASETQETLLADYRSLAQLFELPEQASTNPAVVRNAVKRWFQQHINWLLIFDNVEDLDLLQTFLPDTSGGYILLTTRSQIVGTLGVPLALPTMTQEESVLLLLRRAQLIEREAPVEAVPPALRAQAQMLVDLFDGLPLALDQAGAYLEETQCSLADYLERYGSRRRALLDSRGSGSGQYPASVLATLSLSFGQVEHASPEAAEVLRLCAFLHADAIPETLLSLAGDTLGPTLYALACDPIRLDHAIKELRRYSLIQRDPDTHLLSLHRLVQAMLQEHMEEAEHRMWIERLIHALLRIFPSSEQADQEGEQVRWRQYLSHALACVAALGEMGITSAEAAELLYRIGYHCYMWGDTDQAIPLYEQALAMVLTMPEGGHETVALYCTELGELYIVRKQYRQAEARLRQALDLREQLLGPEHSAVAESLWPLASLFWRLGRYPQAESLAQRAFAILEPVLGSDHPQVGIILNILAAVALYQDHYEQAEHLFLRVIHIYEQALGSEHMFMSSVKKPLADLYMRRACYPQAATLYEQVLHNGERHLGPDHIMLASHLLDLGRSHFVLQQYPQAETMYRRACRICEKTPDADVFRLTTILLYWGALSLVQGHKLQAERYVQRACRLLGETRFPRHPGYEEILRWLLLVGDRLVAGEERMQAQQHLHETLTLGEQLLGPEHPLVLDCRNRLATLKGSHSAVGV